MYLQKLEWPWMNENFGQSNQYDTVHENSTEAVAPYWSLLDSVQCA